MKRSILYVFGIVAMIFVFEMCKHKPDAIVTPKAVDTTTNHKPDTTHKDTLPKKEVSNCNPDTVYFKNTILPLITSNCANPGCHNSTSRAEGYDFTTYAGIMRIVTPYYPNSSKFYAQMNTSKKIMPPSGKMSAANLNLVYTWILQGAKNNFCNSTGGGCDSLNVSYANTLLPIINTYCKGCHGPTLASSGIRLDTYAGISAVAANGHLIAGLTGKLPVMPQTGGKLSDCQIGKFRQWIKEGTKNN